MSEQPAHPPSAVLATLAKVAIALVMLAVFLLPPVKQWLNADPLRLRALYPLLALACAFGLFQAIRSVAGTFALVRWAVILLAAASMTLAVYGAGAVFFTIGKACAIAFIVLEIGRILYEGFVAGDDA